MEENQSAHSIYDVQSQCVSFPVWVKQRCSDWTEHMSVKVRGHASRWPRKPWGRRVYGVFKRNIRWNKVSTFCARIITLETFACFCGGSGRIWVFKKTFPSFFFFFFGCRGEGWMKCGLAAERLATSGSPRSFRRVCRPSTRSVGDCTPISQTRYKSPPSLSTGKRFWHADLTVYENMFIKILCNENKRAGGGVMWKSFDPRLIKAWCSYGANQGEQLHPKIWSGLWF